MMNMLAIALLAWALLQEQAPDRLPFYNTDDYIEFALLDPLSNAFRVTHLVTELNPGTTYHVSRFTHGIATGELDAYNPQNGRRLKTEEVQGEIRVHLPAPVAPSGERRVRIERTFRDEKSYRAEGDDIHWSRTLEPGRYSILLPAGYRIVSTNVAAQLLPLETGQLRIAFVSWHGWDANVTIHARKTHATMTSALSVPERSRDRTETLYDLERPEMHQFNIVHDYEEREIGYRSRLTILMSEPIEDMVVTDLDAGKILKVERQGLMAFAVFEDPVVNEKHTARLRVTGRVQDPSYRVEQNELVWDRSFLGLRNMVVLPAGWELTMLTAPATIGTRPDGRTTISIVNPREDEIRVHFRARQK